MTSFNLAFSVFPFFFALQYSFDQGCLCFGVGERAVPLTGAGLLISNFLLPHMSSCQGLSAVSAPPPSGSPGPKTSESIEKTCWLHFLDPTKSGVMVVMKSPNTKHHTTFKQQFHPPTHPQHYLYMKFAGFCILPESPPHLWTWHSQVSQV